MTLYLHANDVAEARPSGSRAWRFQLEIFPLYPASTTCICAPRFVLENVRRGRVSSRRHNIDPVFLGDRGLTWMCHAIISSWCARSPAAWIFYADQAFSSRSCKRGTRPGWKIGGKNTCVFRVASERFMKYLDISVDERNSEARSFQIVDTPNISSNFNSFLLSSTIPIVTTIGNF